MEPNREYVIGKINEVVGELTDVQLNYQSGSHFHQILGLATTILTDYKRELKSAIDDKCESIPVVELVGRCKGLERTMRETRVSIDILMGSLSHQTQTGMVGLTPIRYVEPGMVPYETDIVAWEDKVRQCEIAPVQMLFKHYLRLKEDKAQLESKYVCILPEVGV